MSMHLTAQPATERSSSMSVTAPWAADGKKAGTRLRGGVRRRNIPRLLLGALLVLICVAVFLFVTAHAGDRRPVLALARAVSVGQVLTVEDLKQVNVAVDPGVSTVDAGRASSVVGRTMSTTLSAGTLLTPDAVTGSGMLGPGQAVAALLLKPGQFPPQIAPGTHVSVVFVPGQPGATASTPSSEAGRSWRAVVTSVTEPTSQQTWVVSVRLSESDARQVAAIPAGQVSVVMLSGGGR